MSSKFIVIGSNSFSGSSFIEYILKQENEVIGISRSVEPNSVFLPYKWMDNSNYKFYQFDLNKDLNGILEVIDKYEPDYIVNFAAQSMVAQSWTNPEHWFQTNVLGTIKLHDELRKRDHIKKYVHISTPEVYGTNKEPIKEHTNYNPSTPYAVSRAACDMSLKTYYQTYHFPVVFTRAANVYGSGQPLYRIVPRTIFYFLTSRNLQLHGGGMSVRSFIHVRDVADGTLKCAYHGDPGEIFHFSTQQHISIKSLVKKIANQMKLSFEDNVEYVGDRLGKDAAYLLDSDKARRELDWSEKINLEQGIEETIRWVKDNLETLKNESIDYIHKP
jgi:dTDP-glucose 4,6-dehydratase